MLKKMIPWKKYFWQFWTDVKSDCFNLFKSNQNWTRSYNKILTHESMKGMKRTTSWSLKSPKISLNLRSNSTKLKGNVCHVRHLGPIDQTGTKMFTNFKKSRRQNYDFERKRPCLTRKRNRQYANEPRGCCKGLWVKQSETESTLTAEFRALLGAPGSR